MTLTEEMIEWAEGSVSPHSGSYCHHCRGRLRILVRVVPRTNGPPVTYYACERCGHVLVRKS